MLYGVNGSGDLFTVNPVTGEMVVIDALMQGSWTCAIDRINRNLYTIGKSSPYPLYRYSLDTEEFTLITNLGMGGPRLEYSVESGLLYFSRQDKLYTIDATNGDVLTQQKIVGIHNTGGGDLKFDDTDGELYLCSFSGLYRLEFGEGDIQAIRISAEDLPFSPTSMTIDSNSELWLATSESNGRLVVMDKVTGGWEYRFDAYDIAINDLTTLPLDVSLIPEEDDDGDGIINFYDEYPEDNEKAYDTYTPSIYGVGTLAFEDLWPAKGDYDFNDLVVNYQFITVSNSSDMVVEVQCNFTVRNIGASIRSGFGLELPFSADLIESVSGFNLTTGNIILDGKGLEANQENTVIIVFDDAFDNQGNELKIVIDFINPIDPNLMGTPPFNPFIFYSNNRGREIHLPNQPPTSLVDDSYFGFDDDDSDAASGRYYKTVSNLPWAIHIIHNFRFPIEKQQVNKGYLKFNEWAESGGTLYNDWYKDNPGYRNTSFLNMTE
jgi:LruC domain-containing protein